jgi:hypothetical protein
MSAKRKPMRLEAEQARPNTRRVSRRISEAVATVRSSHGNRSRARIRDISVFGCSLASDADWLRTGMFVSVEVTGDWTIQAVVRWAREGICGVEFLRPITDSDATALGAE